MKFSPKVDITGISQDVFKEIRLCEAIAANYNVDIFVNHINGKRGAFAISTKNMRFKQWYIYEDIVQYLGEEFEAVDKFNKVEKNPHILIQRLGE